MKFLKRYWPLIAAMLVIALGITLAQAGVLPKSHTSGAAQGTQRDPNVGTSKYPAPSQASHTLAPPPVAVIDNPDAISALPDVNAKCPWAESNSTDRPSLQDAGGGAKKFSDMPDTASTNTLKCAVARAKAAGYYVAGNSVKCDEPIVQLTDESTNTYWNFRPFCMTVSQSGDATCKVTLIPTDYAGNFIWQDMTDLSWDQDILGDKLRLRGSFAGC